jgi:hypothetical protein
MVVQCRRRRGPGDGECVGVLPPSADCVRDAASDGTPIVAACATPRMPGRAAASDASCFEARNLARWL